MIKARAILATVGALAGLACTGALAEDADRLMPSADSAKVRVQQRQDGRALYLTVKNDSALVVTTVRFTCDFRDRTQPLPVRATNGELHCTQEHYLNGTSTVGGKLACTPDATVDQTAREPVRPGKSQEFYFEMHPGWPNVRYCQMVEIRARPPKFWER